MCGIAGIANLSDQSFIIKTEWLEKMQQALQHRGPNGYHYWLDNHKQIGIVHRRLSILDLSAAGTQPMHDDENHIIVACNGEIYNFKQLKKELESYGHRFRSSSDTEVIVYAYKQWGIHCLERLNGMFVIAIFDTKNNELYIIRDRYGIKPLYFSIRNSIFSFASEIKALWQLPWILKEPSEYGIYHYLTFLITPAPTTLYKQVYKLPAGYYLKIDAQKQISFTQWYNQLIDSEEKFRYIHELGCAKTIRTMLRENVHKQLMADVSVGAFLSGGIDSSLIVALMSEKSAHVKTFNVSFSDGQEYSETKWARAVARKFNTEHHEIIISEKEAFDSYEAMVYQQDEPLADCVCIPLLHVSKLAKDAGVSVVLVGEGSDELFCGYNTYTRYLNFYQKYWKHSQRFLPAFAKKGVYHIAHMLFGHWHQELDQLYNWSHNRSFFWSGATVFSEKAKDSIFSGNKESFFDPIIAAIYPELLQHYDSHSFIDYHLKNLKKQQPHADFLSSMIYLELKHRLPELLLTRVDKMTMAVSIEARVPFLEQNLVEYVFNMPTHLKYRNGTTKYILKKAAEHVLPYDTIYRPKMGFAAPTMRWFKEGTYFKPYLKHLLQSKRKIWDPFINIDRALHLLERNQYRHYEDSLELWTIQNLIASNISNQL